MEGRKVFFRVSLAILKLNDRRILHMTDPVTIFQFIKEITKHIFDVNELFNVSVYYTEGSQCHCVFGRLRSTS